MDQLTDLLCRGRAGDREALEAFVRLTQPEVWRLCRYLLGVDNADDATQEIYLETWRSLPSFRGESTARTWLFAIAHRTVWRCAQRTRRRADIDAAAAATERHRGATGDHAESAALRDLIERLGSDRREAFVLTQLFGLTYAEAAVVCSCAVGTIRSRVARAREDLVGFANDRASVLSDRFG